MSQSKANFACLLLAAGSAKRFGTDKRLFAIDGESLLEKSLRIYQPYFAQIHVIVRPQDKVVRATQKDQSIEFVENSRHHQGMSQSIIAGVQATPNVDGWLIALADMPWILPESIRLIMLNAHRRRIVRPVFQGRIGNPVFIGSNFRQDLLLLRGDQGARSLIESVQQQNPEDVHLVEVNDDGVIRDIDRLQDITRNERET